MASINASTAGGGGVITTSDATGNLNIQSGGSTVVAVTSTGATVTGTLAATGASTFTGTGKFATTIGVGNATPSASGSGITFPATQSASSDANTLDDYEEGTWTPNQGSGLTVIGAFSSSGIYAKIGRVVVLTGKVTGATSVAVNASGVISSNLPFASTVEALGCSNNNNLTTNTQVYVGTSNQMFNTTAITATTNIFFTVTYYAAT